MSFSTNFRSRRRPRHGLILLVVLSTLAFFSVLIASYLVFSNQAQATAQAMASQNTRTPDHNGLINDALMTLIRGPRNPNNPLFGQSILGDYIGGDSLEYVAQSVTTPPPVPPATPNPDPNSLGPLSLGSGLIRLPIVRNTSPPMRPATDKRLDGLYAGRVITFLAGPLANRSYRILYSRFQPAVTTLAACDYVYLQLGPNDLSATASIRAIQSVFYQNIGNQLTNGYRFQMRGAERSSRGIGFNATDQNLTQDVSSNTLHQRNPLFPADTTNPIGFTNLPVALQPNQLAHSASRSIDRSTIGGDYDESYEAADYNNWWLSQTDADGNETPSFHRPSVINYILNEEDWSSATNYGDLVASFARGTFRPFPIAERQFGRNTVTNTNSPAIHPRFTGGNTNFALRSPLLIDGASARRRIDQLANALINGPWDVDNEGSGTPDSVWIPVGLPLVTSRDGTLLRPMIATKIHDLSSRLNVNAIANIALQVSTQAGAVGNARWAASRAAITANARNVFRGIGTGPADITLPGTSNSGLITNNVIRDELAGLLNLRYRHGLRPSIAVNTPGQEGDSDALDTLFSGARPGTQQAFGGYGYSIDPYGRSAVGIGRTGHLLTSGSGVALQATPLIDEATDDPYELDPSGKLSGDNTFTLAQLETLLRIGQFDSEFLSQDLRGQLVRLLTNHPEFARSLTTISAADDSLPLVPGGSSVLDGIAELYDGVDTASGTLSAAQLLALLPPEFRLGRKLDVNRLSANGIDDNGNGTIDEPLESLRLDGNSNDDDSDGVSDEPGESVVATINGVDDDGDGDTDEPDEWPLRVENAFVGPAGSLPANYQNQHANYVFDDLPTGSPINFPIPGVQRINGRQLFARHLYVLMMALTNSGYEFPSVGVPNPADFNADEYRARRIAQWAANVVDYRDPDSIPTRFVYDPEPFNGWSPPAEPAPSNRVVWGVESPAIVFSEGMALHDVRQIDTTRDDGDGDDKAGMDQDSDSARMPQGSLILELFCNLPVVEVADQNTTPGVPNELRDLSVPGAATLQLDKLAPPPFGSPVGTLGAPVYRIALSEPHYAGSGNAAGDPQTIRDALPDSASFDLNHPNEQTATPGTITYDRFIFFNDFGGDIEANPDNVFARIGNMLTANNIPPTEMRANQIFFAPRFASRPGFNTQRNLLPGQFLTLAPRTSTLFGSRTDPAATPALPSAQRFDVLPNEGLVHTGIDGIRRTPELGIGDPHGASLPLVIGAPRPSGWTGSTFFVDRMVGLNVSEPLSRGGSYYPMPTHSWDDTDGDGNTDYPLFDGYIDFADASSNCRDEPVDVSTGRLPTVGAAPGAIEPVLGTVPQYCSAFLQRLADPTMPYHRTFNPYLTLDWTSIDLTVFSGEANPSAVTGAGGNYAQRSRQRNGHVKRIGGATVSANALFSYETAFSRGATVTPAATGEFFAFGGVGADPNLQSSFSFLNTAHPISNPGFNGFAANIGSEGVTNVQEMEKNMPNVPFAFHPWLNRPFATPYELMMVPACSAGRLFEEFSTAVSDPAIYPGATSDPVVFNGAMRHLLNFFNSSRDDTTRRDQAAHFVRLFDFVHTLPRFRGELATIDPTTLARRTSNTALVNFELDELRKVLGPPFSFRYENVRQGQVQLNTLSEFPVWAGVMQGHANQAEFASRTGAATQNQLSFNRFLRSRRGYTVMPSVPAPPMRRVTGAAPYNYAQDRLDPDYPTQFAGVFKRSIDAEYAPTLRDSAVTNRIRRRGANSTLLRAEGTLQEQESGPATTAMFVRDSAEAPLTAFQDRSRNAFTRFQTLMRMPNLVSDNSQVYVIWLTLGYFEVDPNNTNNLGREYKADSGENERFRAMFIVDRSRPVGYEPGENLNSRDIVIYESFDQ